MHKWFSVYQYHFFSLKDFDTFFLMEDIEKDFDTIQVLKVTIFQFHQTAWN